MLAQNVIVFFDSFQVQKSYKTRRNFIFTQIFGNYKNLAIFLDFCEFLDGICSRDSKVMFLF